METELFWTALKWINATEESITDLAVNSSSAKILPENTVLLAMYGATVGQLGILQKPMTCNQACCALVANESIANFKFIFYQLLQARSELKNLATGAAQQNLSGILIRSLRFPYPHIKEQQAIAHILGTLDDKIELNRKKSETLEAMARALFKSWFVDFDPVVAKMEGRWKQGESLPGMPAELWELFPDRLVDSELGEIPEGWEVINFLDFVEPCKERVAERNIPTYSCTNEGLFPRAKKFKKQLAKSNSMNKVVRRNDIVFGLSRQILNFGVMKNTICSVSPAYHVFSIDNSLVSSDFVEKYMRLRAPVFFSILGASSREGQSISVQQLYQTGMLIPPKVVQSGFDELTGCISSSVEGSRGQVSTLSDLRDTLLPKLISGELRVKDAKKFLSKAGV